MPLETFIFLEKFPGRPAVFALMLVVVTDEYLDQ